MYETKKHQKGYNCIMPKTLLYATHVLNNDTGELSPFTDKAKLIYLHMFNQYRGFNRKGCKYYEAHNTIGNYFGISEKQSQRVIKQLKNFGLVDIVQVGYNQYNTTVYGIDKIKGVLVNTSIDEAEKIDIINEDKKLKISSDQYLARQANNKRWEQIETILREEKQQPYINHKKEKLHNITASLTEYKEFQQWKENKGDSDNE